MQALRLSTPTAPGYTPRMPIGGFAVTKDVQRARKMIVRMDHRVKQRANRRYRRALRCDLHTNGEDATYDLPRLTGYDVF